MRNLILVAVLFATPAAAQNCAPLDQVAQGLTDQYGETVQASGLAGNGAYVMWWGNPETGTWTVTATNPDGMTCLVASGEAFDANRQAPGVDG